MKRQIKFRAWDEVTKAMYQVRDIDFLADMKINSIRLVVCIQTSEDDIEFDFPIRRNGEYELMQFTGLQDKNGVDIYEGDILKIQYFKVALGQNLGVTEVEAELKGVIEIYPLALVLKNITGEKWCEYTGYDQGEGECKIFHLHDVYEDSSDAEYQIEIIGNIHQNPELL